MKSNLSTAKIKAKLRNYGYPKSYRHLTPRLARLLHEQDQKHYKVVTVGETIHFTSINTRCSWNQAWFSLYLDVRYNLLHHVEIIERERRLREKK